MRPRTTQTEADKKLSLALALKFLDDMDEDIKAIDELIGEMQVVLEELLRCVAEGVSPKYVEYGLKSVEADLAEIKRRLG